MNKIFLTIYIILSVVFVLPHNIYAQEHDGHGDEHEEGIHVDQDMQKTIGLSFERVQLRAYTQNIRVYGEVAQDTDKYTHVTSHDQGVVTNVYVQTGDIVDANDPIVALTIDDGAVKTISASHHGTITAIHVKVGDKVDNLRSLISLTDLDTLRVSFDVYEKDLRFVSVGQDVNVYSTAYPDETFKGRVVFVSPRIDRHTQTVKIRADVDNSQHLLKLGMFVIGDVISTTGSKVLSVSQKCVQQIKDEYVVFVSDNDEFRAKDVQVGGEFGEFIEIKEGLHDEDQVVAKGSFALKSQMQKGAFGDGHNH